MNVIIVFICFLISAIIPQALYFIFPVLFLYSLVMWKSVLINSFTKLYIGISLAVGIFLCLHTFYFQSLEFMYLKGALRYFAYTSFALYVARLSEREILVIFKIILLYVLLTIPLGVYQFLVAGRGANIFASAPHYGYVLVIFISFFLNRKTSFSLPIYFILFLALILTKTSGAILTLFLLILIHYQSKVRGIILKIPLVLIILSISFLGFYFSPKIMDQISSLQYVNIEFIKQKIAEGMGGGGHGSFIWRLVYWAQILIAFFENNMMVIFIGEGIDALSKSNRDMYSFLYTDPHNDFLKIFVEYGVIGLLLFLFLFYRLVFFMGKRLDVLIILAIPLFFDNMIVNWSYNTVFILYLTFFYKRYNRKVIDNVQTN